MVGTVQQPAAECTARLTTEFCLELNADTGDSQQLNPKTNTKSRSPPESWSNGIEFLMSCLAMSVGLGNVWRFPVAAHRNGGGAFLIPYIVVLVLIGNPMYYLEMILGQFFGVDSIRVYRMVPLMRGIGYGQVFALTMLASFYGSLMALILWYFLASFRAELPWSWCRPEWAVKGVEVCVNSSLRAPAVLRAEGGGAGNLSVTVRSSAEWYFRSILNEPATIHSGIGAPDPHLAALLAIAWLTLAIILCRGIQSAGKISYFLALFPYATMAVLFVRAITLPGSSAGILYFLTPDWRRLLDVTVWFEAVSQMFFSICVSLAVIIQFASFNRIDRNIQRDVMIVTIADTCTSMLSGIIVFGILGNLAHETGAQGVDELAQTGFQLAFVSYPNAIAKFAWGGQLFAVVFFFMLFVLGMGSLVGIGVVLSALLRRASGGRLGQRGSIAVVVLVQFGMGLVYLTPGGQFILAVVDFHGVSLVVYVLAIAELVAVCWMYGVRRLCADVEFMIGQRTGWFRRWCWRWVTPALMVAILGNTLWTLEPLRYNRTYEYPALVYAIGWLLTICGLLPLIICAILAVHRAEGRTLWKKMGNSIRPPKGLGPRDPALNARYQQFLRQRLRIESGEAYTEKIEP